MNVAGEKSVIEELKYHLSRHFGELDVEESERGGSGYTCVGVQHHMLADGSTVLNQDKYIAALQPVVHPELTGRAGEEEATPTVTSGFRTLLGGIAYALITKFWIMVFVVALQRKSKCCQIIHVRRLNALLRALQKRPAKLLYQAMKCVKQVEAHSGSGFCREEDSGYGIRGYENGIQCSWPNCVALAGRHLQVT